MKLIGFKEFGGDSSSIRVEVTNYINSMLSDYKHLVGFQLIISDHDTSYSFYLYDNKVKYFSDYSDDLIQFFGFMKYKYGVNELVFMNSGRVVDCTVDGLEDLPEHFKFLGILFKVGYV